jgi:hypothetical protein
MKVRRRTARVMPNVGVDRHVSNDLSDIAAYVRAFTASLKKRAQRCQIVGIGATHRPSDEWPHRRSHHETPIRIELRDFVRVRKLAAKEVSDERNA